MADLYATPRSAVELERIELGQLTLCNRLNAPPYSSGQGTGFMVQSTEKRETRRGHEYDVFKLRGVTAPLDKQWRNDETSHGFIVNATSSAVSVPLSYYTSSYALPFRVDTGLVVRFACWVGVGLLMLWLWALL